MNKFYEQEEKYIINTYNRRPGENPLLIKGDGVYVWDENQKRYLDLVGGLAVNIIGHCHPEVVSAIQDQASRLIHTSNLFYTRPQVDLARLLVNNSAADCAFFCNSGAEANEAAVKLARKYGAGRYKVITARHSFHGRTLAMVAATGQPRYQQGFEPLPAGFLHGEFNNLESFQTLVDDETAAVMVEPVQGEGGVHVAGPQFLQGLRRLCDETGTLLIFDEVQCGLGRTGRLWAYEHYGVEPDIFTVAKGLGGGLPIGVMLARKKIAAAFQPGDHASTFGGNPVACRSAIAVMEVLLQHGFLEQVEQKAAAWNHELQELAESNPELVKEVRGLGFISALELKIPAAQQVRRECQENGLLVNAIGERILRFLPPLIISEEQIQQAVTVLRGIFRSYPDWQTSV